MRPKKVDSIDLSKYIVAKVWPLNHLKLQKLLYYVESYHLAYFDKSIINDEFEAWLHGPVSRKLWDRLKAHANVYDNVPINQDNRKEIIKDFWGKITEEQKELINDVLKEYGKETSYALECMTHSEKPWREARKGYAPDDKCEGKIDKDLMRTFYKQYLYT